jgi:hypothetical protein
MAPVFEAKMQGGAVNELNRVIATAARWVYAREQVLGGRLGHLRRVRLQNEDAVPFRDEPERRQGTLCMPLEILDSAPYGRSSFNSSMASRSIRHLAARHKQAWR